ncbi:MAG: arylesterase [Lysobacterales bacterium]
MLRLSTQFSLLLAALLVIATATALRVDALEATDVPDPRPIMVLGDSLSAAYNLPLGDGWVDLLATDLSPCGVPVVNASISGDTSAGGQARLPELLDRHHPSIVVVELGGNDGLRGLSTARLYENLRDIAVKSQAAGASVVLAGMQIPGNYGARYRKNFAEIYRRLSEDLGLTLIPFLLEGVALEPGMIQGDGIHPTSAAQPLIRDTVLPFLLSAGLKAECDR